MTSLVSGEHWEQLFSLHFALIYPFQIGPLKHGTAVIERNSDIILEAGRAAAPKPERNSDTFWKPAGASAPEPEYNSDTSLEAG